MKTLKKLYQQLEEYSGQDYYPFHMPGHKRNTTLMEGKFLFERDITEIEGFDNLHHAEGILKRAQEDAARLYGTKESFYCVNGSTAALMSAISAAVSRNGKILMARNCHKSVYNTLYLRNIQPVYLYPQLEKEFGINGGISVCDVGKKLAEHDDIEAVLITSPTYDGIVSDVEKIAEIVHRHGILLIVDEAHGAHLRFSDYFPASAAERGADVVVQSLHKTLPAMTQTALLHICSERVNREQIKKFLGIYQTSSPSYILMASMDACIDMLAGKGTELFAHYTENLKKTRDRLEKHKKIRLLTEEVIGRAGIYDFDKSKLLFSTRETSLTGRILYQILLEQYHLQMEMQSEDYVLAMTAAGDTEEGFQRLCEAIGEIEKKELQKAASGDAEQQKRQFLRSVSPYMEMKQGMSPAEAAESPAELCVLEDAVGRISTEFVYLYPPGIPILVPGEYITGLFVENMRRYKELGLDVQGLCDYTGRTIYVVKE